MYRVGGVPDVVIAKLENGQIPWVLVMKIHVRVVEKVIPRILEVF